MLNTGTIVDVVRAHARRRPDQTAFSFLAVTTSGFGITRELSYGELHAAAHRVGAALRRSHAPGERVLVACPPGPEFLVSFLGSLYAGVIPVPAPAPVGSREQLVRQHGIIASAGVCAVLTDEQHVDKARSLLAESAPTAWCGTPAQLTAQSGEEGGEYTRPDTELPSPSPDSLAFLQYTSGSTSEPRGVMVSHANVRENLRLIQRSYGLTSEVRIGGWLPPYHDMGLVGTLLLPLFLGTEAFIMTPAAFLRRPRLWLEMIGTYGIGLSPAPNFAYDMCVRRIPADQAARLNLSGWRWAVNGAEPVHASTVRRFTDHFAPAGFRPEALCPSYGMAEVALLVCAGPGDAAPVMTEVDGAAFDRNELKRVRRTAAAEAPRVAVSSGPCPDAPDDGSELHIVDPESCRELADGGIGEIWLRGPSVGRGYWRREEETDRVFRAYTADGAGPYLRTGDLGARHDGQLYVTGRIKEVLILNGRNIYPQDIERVARDQHPACADGAGAAFTVPVGDGDERVVLVQEIRARDMDEPALRELARGVTAALSTEFGVAVGNVAFVQPGGVLRSTSGKVRRVAMRELFTSGVLAPVFEEVDDSVRERFRPGDVPATASHNRPNSRELLK